MFLKLINKDSGTFGVYLLVSGCPLGYNSRTELDKNYWPETCPTDPIHPLPPTTPSLNFSNCASFAQIQNRTGVIDMINGRNSDTQKRTWIPWNSNYTSYNERSIEATSVKLKLHRLQYVRCVNLLCCVVFGTLPIKSRCYRNTSINKILRNCIKMSWFKHTTKLDLLITVG